MTDETRKLFENLPFGPTKAVKEIKEVPEIDEKVLEKFLPDMKEWARKGHDLMKEVGFVLCRTPEGKIIRSEIFIGSAFELMLSKCPVGKRVGSFHTHAGYAHPSVSDIAESLLEDEEVACVSGEWNKQINCYKFNKEAPEYKKAQEMVELSFSLVYTEDEVWDYIAGNTDKILTRVLTQKWG